MIEARALAGLLLFGEKTIACSAHEARTTRLSFERVLSYFDAYDELRRRVQPVQRWVGREQIRLRDGSVIVFPARSRGALRGYSCDALILDEAQYVTSAQYEAVLPTLSARPNPQTWLLGTVPTHVGDGEVLGHVRSAALGPDPGALCYLEWSADPGCDLDDREAWAGGQSAARAPDLMGSGRRRAARAHRSGFLPGASRALAGGSGAVGDRRRRVERPGR